MAICNQCNKTVPQDASFCRYCGCKLENRNSGSELNDASPEINSTQQCDNNSNHQAVNSPRPWLRFWARHIDIFIFSIIAAIAFPPIDFFNAKRLSLLQLHASGVVMCMIVEILSLGLIGSTPGKWIANIKLSNYDGSKISFSQAMGRTIIVWIRGMWTYFPIIQYIPMFMAKKFLSKNGTTPWDLQCRTVVSHGPVSLFRYCGIATALILSFVLWAITIAVFKNK